MAGASASAQTAAEWSAMGMPQPAIRCLSPALIACAAPSARSRTGVEHANPSPKWVHLDLEHHGQPTRMRCVGHVAGAARRLESGHCERQSDFLMFEFHLRVTHQNAA